MPRSIVWTTSDILLLCEYSNYAWARVHRGWYITSTGEIRTFTLDPSKASGYDDVHVGDISFNEVVEIQDLLETAVSAPWNECHRACDMGTFESVGFIPPISPLSPNSVEVILAKHGDVEGKNATEAAEKLLKLIDRIKPASIDHWHLLTDDF